MTGRRPFTISRSLALVGVALLALACPPSTAQQRVASGRALDASLQVGSGGYNRTGRGGRGFMQRPSYSVSRGGRAARRYNQAAFGGPRQFRPARGQGVNDLWTTGERYY